MALFQPAAFRPKEEDYKARLKGAIAVMLIVRKDSGLSPESQRHLDLFLEACKSFGYFKGKW